MAKDRGITPGTIVAHLEKLIAEQKIDPESDLDHLKIEPSRFLKIQAAFETLRGESNDLRLTPLKDLLGEEFSFDELRLARLFLLN